MSQNNTKTWEVNGVILELDLEDAAVMERYEAAFEQMTADEKLLPKDGKASERIRAYCQMFHRLFDAIFGEGTAEQIFGEHLNSAEHDAVYLSFLEFVRTQTSASVTRRAQQLQKYRPNRAAKRAVKKK